MHEIERQVLLRLPSLWGVDLSVTNEVLLLWLSAAVTFILVAAACRRREPVARGWFQNLFEALVELVDKEIVRNTIGGQGGAWTPFLLTLFFFILFCNLLGMVPLPSHVKAITSDFSVTAGLAAMVFVITLFAGVRKHGLTGFASKFVPRGIHPAVAILVIPIEVISWLAKPLSLAIRLFANMMVGHMLILVFVGLEVATVWFVLPLPLAGAVIMSAFEVFICFIQALIFTMLTGIYIREALEAH